MLGISDAVELTKKVGDLVRTGVTIGLQETIMDLREAVLNAKDEVLNLRAELQAYKSKELEAQNWQDLETKYPLVKAPGGGTVRKTAGPPEHYVCPKCFEDRRIYPLQDKRVMSGEYACPGCGKSFPVDQPKKFEPISYPTRGGGGPNDWMSR
jgi:predicted RNA-binding Zn-ribbon protein involved in translation (DUF1610 family)